MGRSAFVFWNVSGYNLTFHRHFLSGAIFKKSNHFYHLRGGVHPMESYCGKNCMQCSYFIQRCCPGCKWGPGQPVQGVCPLARCCREKGHGTCRSCSLAYHCGLLAQRDFFPPRPASSPYPPRQVRPASIPQVPPPTVENAAILSRWLGWLFFFGTGTDLLR